MNELEERRWRLYTIMAVIIGCILVIAGRLFYLQVAQHDYYRSLAKEEHWREVALPAKRGSIWDSGGHRFAASVAYESLYTVPSQMDNPSKTARVLSTLLDVPVERIESLFSTQQKSPVLIKALLSADKAQEIRNEMTRQKLWDVYLEPQFRRVYPEGSVSSQLIGLVGKDDNGLTGVEAQFDGDLAGKAGSLLAERDTGGDEIALSTGQYRAPIDGSDVVLTLDRYVQRVIDKELDAAIQSHQAAGGTIIVLEPNTGAVLGMAVRPTFDLNDPDLFHPSRAPLYRNRAVSDVWEPGSVFKIVTMAAGLDTGTVTPDHAFENKGAFTYGGGTVRNVVTRVGPETMTQVLQRSSNIGAAYVSTKMGAERFYQYVKAFGFGQPTGIDLPGESPGIMRTPGQPNWYPFDLATNSFGQGISVTPIQMATAVAAVANGGLLMKPYVVSQVIGKEGQVRRYDPTIIREVISPDTARTLRDMLVSVVEQMEDGQVKAAKVPGYLTGGKTGTAEIPTTGGYTGTDTVASFVGFGPADNPQFVILVRIDSPKDTPWGETVAAPVFRKVAQQLLPYHKIPPTGQLAARR
ncbi:MAG: penicillin-binding protein 2 [Chloroflexi bacterium]|nr:penicillin-binding protein 2 [Chloroflexota bacterium]